MVSEKEFIPRVKGHLHLAVYEGDVERRPLTLEQIRENTEFAQQFPELPFPLHIGETVSRPIDEYDYDNVVTTNGKGLYLDRLFAMGGPPAAVTFMGVGNSATGAVVGDTQLLGATPSPTLLAFDALPTRAGLVVTAIRTYATGEGNMNWQEIGQFNGGTNGTSILFNRIAPIGAFNKTSAVSIGATVTTTQS
jgi:hypothetical protein